MLGSMAAATTTMSLLAANYASAQTVRENDPAIRASRLVIETPRAVQIKAYMVEPVSKQILGSIIVVHENRGLNPHTEDVARRLAKENFTAVAIDLLSSFGGTPENEETARNLFAKLDMDTVINDVRSMAKWLEVTGAPGKKIGLVGFCWGGGVANLAATQVTEIAAAVAFYGAAPPAAAVPSIRAKLLLHFAGLDERINAMWPTYEAALKASGVEYDSYVYPNVNHAFFNDTAGPRYDEAAATLAWERTLAFFRGTLV